MQITWLFGNGLDISLGLKTRYIDFYKYLEDNEKEFDISNNYIFIKLKSDFDKGKDNLWADYEVRLGEILIDVNEDEIENFIRSKIQLDIYLNEYLTEVSQGFQVSKDVSKSMLEAALLDITKDKKLNERNKIREVMSDYSKDNCNVNAISFNYTNALSLIWDGMQDEFSHLRFFDSFPTPNYKIILNDVFYLHGTLNNGEMVIGVNDSSQLMNEKLKDNELINFLMIKKSLLETAGQSNLKRFENIIYSSMIICLFGLSIGETDKMYWDIIKQRLLSDSSVKLIIYEYRVDSGPFHIFVDEMRARDVKNRFYKNSNATEEEIERINTNILVEMGHEIFTIQKDE